MTAFVGTSGWSYDHWHGILYPHGAPLSVRLGYYVQRFDTVELNASYYRWPADRTFAGWKGKLPAGFLLSVKASRGLTHFKRLYEPEQWLARMEGGLRALGDKRGVLLVQLPPGLVYDYARLDYFLAQLPAGQRTAIEFRHDSWHREEVFDLLALHGVAYTVMSGAHLPCILRATASFVYVRLHGPDDHHLYGGSYSDGDLRWWAERVREWEGQGRDVFAYFNNDGGGNAVHNALTLRGLLRPIDH